MRWRMAEQAERAAIFVSHANPESNAFARWLGAKLTGLGYEVWADVMRLHGGSDWARELENALRRRSVKMLLACTPLALEKQGVRNEIEIASQLAPQLKDSEFIIPLRLEAYEPPFRIAHLQYVDFAASWGDGLREVLELLTSARVPRRGGQSTEPWLPAQASGGTRLTATPENLTSNWLKVRRLPTYLNYCEGLGGVPLEQFQDRMCHGWSVVPFKSGVLTFAKPHQKRLDGSMPARLVNTVRTRTFLDAGWKDLGIEPWEARRLFSDLGNHALETFLATRGLTRYATATGRSVWWGAIGVVPLTKVRFDWPRQSGRRQIIGQSGKRKAHWHYAIGVELRTSPVHHVRVKGRLIFSENGLDAIGDVKRMHRLRRTFARSWRNARWRDMMIAFLWWLGEGRDELVVPVSYGQGLVLALPPVQFTCPVSVVHFGEEPLDEDDPDIDVGEWDDWEEGGAEGGGEN